MILLGLAGIFAILEWIGEYQGRQRLIFLTKPMAMICLIAWFWSFLDLSSYIEAADLFPLGWFLIGLVFCLAGDIFLMLPPGRFFLPGLVVFLLGHVFYIIGFGKLLPPPGSYAPALILALLVLIVALSIYQKLIEGMVRTDTEKMKLPVTIYSVVITLMLLSAFNTNFLLEWHYFSAWLVSLGALSFYFSDILNAWVRFRAPLPNGRVFIMVTYHLGQLGLAAGVALHFKVG